MSEGSRKVLFYQQRPKSLEGRFRRSNYVHPLYDLDERVLTEDFPADHPHQRGIYWAWHQLWVGDRRVGDPWVASDFETGVEGVEAAQDGESVTLRVRAVWKSPRLADAAGKPIPIVSEETLVRVQRGRETHRLIDFTISLRAKLPGVRIGGSEDEKGYGGFSVRVRLPKDLKFSATGGPLEPKLEALRAGPWVDLAAADWGLAILVHPSNPGFPQSWILRRQRSMQNPVYPGREPVLVPRDKPLVLRYRLVVHRGQLGGAALDALQKEYAAERE